MKKFILVSLFIIMLSLSGCGHRHSFSEATCIEPKICTICGTTEGVALGHIWLDADCDSPQTCSVCKTKKGAALGHTWLDADCDNPQTCSVCRTKKGVALGHTVDVGLCDRCNTIQNEALLTELSSRWLSVGENINTIGVLITSANTYSLDDVYTKLNQAQSYLSVVTSGIQDIYDLCEGYHDLSSLKNQAKRMLDAIPKKVSGNDRNSIIASLSEYANMLRQSEATYNELAKYVGLLAEAGRFKN